MSIDFAHRIAKHISQTDMEIEEAVEELGFSEEVECDSLFENEVKQEIDRCDQCKIWYSREYCYNSKNTVLCDSCLNSSESGISS